MPKRSETELEDPKNWDYDRPIRKRGTKVERAVVSVAFDRPSFDLVSLAARRYGTTLSEFIREASIARAEGEVTIVPSSTSGQFVYAFPSRTATTYLRNRVAGEVVQPPAQVTTALVAG